MIISPSDQAATLRARAQLRKQNKTKSTRKPRTLAISSGKGGAGKTIVAVNLALRFARSGLRTLLIDLDPGLANVDVHMRLDAKWDVDDVLRGNCAVQDAVLVADSGLRVLPGGRASEATQEQRSPRDESGPQRLLDSVLRAMPDLDVVLLDTGAGIGPWVRGSLALADCNLVVTQSDPASVTDAYSVLKLVSQTPNAARSGILVNRVRDKREAMLTATRLRKVSKQFLGGHPEFFGWVHDRDVIADSVHDQVPFSLQLGDAHGATLELAAVAARIADHLKLPA